MPTEISPFDEIRRLAAARDEALRRYTQHLSAVQFKNSRWSVLLSHARRTPAVHSRPLGSIAGNLPSHAH